MASLKTHHGRFERVVLPKKSSWRLAPAFNFFEGKKICTGQTTNHSTNETRHFYTLRQSTGWMSSTQGLTQRHPWNDASYAYRSRAKSSPRNSAHVVLSAPVPRPEATTGFSRDVLDLTTRLEIVYANVNSMSYDVRT